MNPRAIGSIVAAMLVAAGIGVGFAPSAQANGLLPLTLEQPAVAGEVFVADSAGVFAAVFSGVAAEGETVTVARPGSVLCQAVAGADERWSCTVAAMPDFFGDVTVSDSSDTITETFGAVNPPRFDPDLVAGIETGEATLAVKGRSAGGAVVEVVRAGVTVCTTTANGDGNWGCVITLSDTDAGISTLVAVQTPPYASSPSASSPPVSLDYEPTIVAAPVTPAHPSPPSPPGSADPPVLADPPVIMTPPIASDPSLAPQPALGDAAEDALGRAPGAEAVEPGAASRAAGVGDPDAPAAGTSTVAASASASASASTGAAVAAASDAPRIAGRIAASPPADRSDRSGESGRPAAPAHSGSTEADATSAAPSGATDWQSPTSFGTSLRPIGAVPFGDPAFTTSVVLVMLGLLMLIALPAELLQSTLRENYDRIAPRVAPVQRFVAAARRRVPAIGWIGQLVVIGCAAVVTSFADPTIGFDARSLRLMLALALVLLLVNYVGILAGHVHAGRIYAARTSVALRPAALLLVIVSVIVSRVADIQPGLLFGLLLGLEIGGRLRRHREARVALSVNLILLAMGVGSWLLFSAFAAQWQANATFGNQLAGEVLTGLTVETITAAVIALLPLTFLDGKTIYTASKAAWAGVYTLAMAAFAVVILPLPSTWVEVPSLFSPWALAFAAFGVLSVGVWAYFRLRPVAMPADDAAQRAKSSSTSRLAVSSSSVHGKKIAR